MENLSKSFTKICFLGSLWASFVENISRRFLMNVYTEILEILKIWNWEVCERHFWKICPNYFSIQLFDFETFVIDVLTFLLVMSHFQGFCRRSVKPTMAPLRVRNLSFSRDNCMLCKELNPKKDSRTCKSCFKCGNGSCTQHSKIICLSCARQ